MPETSDRSAAAELLGLDFSSSYRIAEFVRLASCSEEENYVQYRIRAIENGDWTPEQLRTLAVVTKVMMHDRQGRRDEVLEMLKRKGIEV